MRIQNLLIISSLFLLSSLFVISCGKKEKTPYHSSNDEFLHKEFVHPGMFQNKQDLEFMRSKILDGATPWIDAYNKLKAETDTNFIPRAFTYVSVGAYGANSVGGKEFSTSAKVAYNNALMWYITNDKNYASKAIEILNAWSYKLWGFDGNNAKLNVGLNGHYFLNAAEILRYTESGWNKKDVEQFERLTLTVFYPTIKDFFTEANGNWDASIIATMFCIAVFTDNHEIFNTAIERYYRGEGNSGITKYIYPGGQCQEAIRDWDHVQLGLGELSNVAQIAWTQGLDLYSVADNRLAQGFEYTAKFLTGNNVDCFGEISIRDKDKIRDIYESIYKHYATIKEINLNYSGEIIRNITRENSSLKLLIATRASDGKQIIKEKLNPLNVELKIEPTETGALAISSKTIPSNTIFIHPGEDIQSVIDKNPNGYIVLRKGVHFLSETLKIRDGITLAGEGRESILMLNEDAQAPTIINASNHMSNVVIRDILIEGAIKPGTGFDPNYERAQRLYPSAHSREGIIFTSDSIGKMKNILLENITVQNFTKNGVLISGAKNVMINKCDCDNNGSSVVPGVYFHHNLRLTRVSDCKIKDSRFDSSLWGNGVEISFSKNITIENNEFARNKLSGIHCLESEKITINSNLIEGNDKDGISVESLKDGCEDVVVIQNLLQYNNGYAIRVEENNGVYIKNNQSISNKFP